MPLFTLGAKSHHAARHNIANNYMNTMKKRYIIGLLTAILTFLGAVFQGAGTEYLKRKFATTHPTTEVQKPAPKKVSYTVKFTREVSE